MLFNSFSFLIFFPTVLFGYWLLPQRARPLLLLVASCYFYMAFVPAYILILLYLIALDYTLARLMERSQGKERKFYFLISILSTIAVLVIFKYFNFFNANIGALSSFLGWHYGLGALSLILPIGLSFHTFQSLAYVIEVYRGNYPAERNFLTYALYVMYFPQLVAGPIERPARLLPQLKAVHVFDWTAFTNGLQRMGLGFFKKMVVADNLAIYINHVYAHPHDASGFALLAATLFFAIQIYYDFSGYSDIAIGAAQTMGITLVENFKTPYFAASLKEFWSRWHISLSSWFRDYLYIPLGGNRGTEYQWTRNILITFLVSGLWHGANWTYVIWGLIHGTFLIVEQWFQKVAISSHALITGLVRALTRAGALGVVLFAWIFFRANTLSDAWYIVTNTLPRAFHEFMSLITGNASESLGHSLWVHLFEPLTLMNLGQKQELLIVGGIAVFLGIEYMESRFGVLNFVRGRHPAVRWIVWLCLVLLITNLGATNEVPFIYFQF